MTVAMPDSTQVVIYFNDPKGQLMQTTMGAFRRKWEPQGWSVLREAPQLPLGEYREETET